MTTTPHHTAPAHSGTARLGRSSPLQVTSAYGAAVLTGLFAGFLLTVLVLELSMRSESAAVYTRVPAHRTQTSRRPGDRAADSCPRRRRGAGCHIISPRRC